MSNFIFGQYIPGSGLIYRINPQLKLIAFVLLIISSFFNHSWIGFGFLLIICAGLIQASQVGWKFFWKGISFFVYMILLTCILQMLFSKGGTVFWHWGFFSISNFGLQTAMLAFFKFLVAVIGLTIYLMTTDPAQIAQTIQVVCYPLKFLGVNLDDIGLVTAIALRFVPTLTDEVITLRNAQQARGVNYQSHSFIKSIKSSITILLPLFFSVFRRAEQLASAMILRGYTDGKQRTHLSQIKWDNLDRLILVVVLLNFFMIIFLNLSL